MSKSIEHSCYTIESAPSRLAESGGWKIRIFISGGPRQTEPTRSFSNDGVYATEEEADMHGISFGERIIDGNVQGLSLE